MRSKSSLTILSIAALATALMLGGCSTAPSVRIDSLQLGQPQSSPQTLLPVRSSSCPSPVAAWQSVPSPVPISLLPLWQR